MSSRKILLWSDGSKIFTVLDQVFSEAGYQTRTERHSRGASEAMRRGGFHLLITRVHPGRREPLNLLKSLRRQHPGMTAIILRGEHEVNSAIEAYHLQDEEESFIPCGWPGLRRLVASCLSRQDKGAGRIRPGESRR
jgi:DNA-binding NtrC family response regulator